MLLQHYHNHALTSKRRDCFLFIFFLFNEESEILTVFSFTVRNEKNTEKIQTARRVLIQNISSIKMIGISGLLLRDLPEALCCDLEHETLTAA